MKLLKNVLALMLLFSMLLSVISCDNDKDGEKEPPENLVTVTVKNPLGKPMPGITVFIHEDAGEDYNVCMEPLTTDEGGKISVVLDPEKAYSLQIMQCPKVYKAKSGATPSERYSLSEKNVDVVLEFSDGYAPESYSLGDYAADFSLTDIEGNEYSLSELLKTKKAVMLNFWYNGCYYCELEFPSLNTAYGSYKDKLEILAINDFYGNSLYQVENFESQKNIKLDMPLFKVESDAELSISRIKTGGAQGWPTTVIIDRYGVVSFIHAGAVTSVDTWSALFDYFVSDSYSGAAVGDIRDVI